MPAPEGGNVKYTLAPKKEQPFHEWLRGQRRAQDLTQSQLGLKIGYSQNHISNIENQNTPASAEFQKTVRNFFQ